MLGAGLKSALASNTIYRISSNNSWGQLFLFLHKKRIIIRGKAVIQGKPLFQIIIIAHWKLSPKIYYFVLFSH